MLAFIADEKDINAAFAGKEAAAPELGKLLELIDRRYTLEARKTFLDGGMPHSYAHSGIRAAQEHQRRRDDVGNNAKYEAALASSLVSASLILGIAVFERARFFDRKDVQEAIEEKLGERFSGSSGLPERLVP